jgi:hypothetical protein
LKLKIPNFDEGEIYFTLDGSDPRETGGKVHGLKYTKPILVESSTVVKARFLSKNFGIWSALAEKPVLFDGIYGEKVVITEIMYHPEDGNPEFIEIFNAGENTVVLDGFAFSKGIDFTFNPGSTIYPGVGLVLTNDTSLFKNVYGFSAFGQYNKQLSNSGETVILINRYAQTVDSISYSDSIPWPPEADGDGYSIELADLKLDNSDWQQLENFRCKKWNPV